MSKTLKALIISAFVLILSLPALGAGMHIVYGEIENQPVPANGDISFFAYITARPHEIQTEINKNIGSSYDFGFWYVNTGSFPTDWFPGETLHIEIFNKTNGEWAVTEVPLTADIDVATPVTLSPTALNTPDFTSASGQPLSASLEWSVVNGSNGYNLYRRRSVVPAGKYELVIENHTNTNYLDTGLEANAGYHYILVAKNGGTSSAHSDEQAVTALDGVPPALTSIIIDVDQISLNPAESYAFTVTAEFDNGQSTNIIPDWDAPAKGSIQGNTYTAPSSIAVDETIALSCSYTHDGVLKQDTVDVDLDAVVLSSISLAAENSTVRAGKSLTLTATGTFDNGSSEVITDSVTWTYSHGSVANGVFTAPTAPADVTITAHKDGIDSNDISIDVEPDVLNVAKSTLSAPEYEVGPNGTIVLTAVGKDQYENVISAQYAWSVNGDGNSIANGTFTAGTKADTYTASVTITDPRGGNITLTKELTVVPGPLAEITIEPSEVPLEQGDIYDEFVVKAYDEYKNERNDTLSVRCEGLQNSLVINADEVGNYTLEVYKGTIKAEASITVIPKLDKISLDIEGAVVRDDSLVIKPVATDVAGNKVDLSDYNLKYDYEVTGAEYGNQIDENGKFTRGTDENAEGEQTIKVTLSTPFRDLDTHATIKVDLGAPRVDKITVGDKKLDSNMILSSQPNIEVALHDGNGIKEVRLLLNGDPISCSSQVVAQDADAKAVSYSLTLEEEIPAGYHTLTIEFEDNVGNIDSVLYSGIKVYDALQIVGTARNYPNPFKPSVGTTFYYELSQPTSVKIYIYDLGGRLIYSTLEDATADVNEVFWNARNTFGEEVANGVYVYFILTTDGKILAKGEMAAYE